MAAQLAPYKMDVAVYNIHRLFVCSGLAEAFRLVLSVILRPVLVYQPVHMRMATGHRPEYRSGGQAVRLRAVKNIGHPHDAVKMLPLGGNLAQNGLFVVDNAMSVGIAAGTHGGMAGIGYGRIDGPVAPDDSRLLPDGAEGRKLPEGAQVLIHHRILTDNHGKFCFLHY